MKNFRIGSIVISILILCSLAFNLTGCAAEGNLSNKGNTPRNFSSQDASVTNFAIRLFKECEESGKNTLVSPLSVLCALAMTANGAEEETLAQMESVLGMTSEDLNGYLHSYLQNLPQGEGYGIIKGTPTFVTKCGCFFIGYPFLSGAFSQGSCTKTFRIASK